MKENITNDLLLSLSVSFFGLLLIFGLGFVFPTMNPYSAIAWIVIICAVFFAYSFISYFVMKFMDVKAKLSAKKAVKKEVKEVKKASKAKKTSKK